MKIHSLSAPRAYVIKTPKAKRFPFKMSSQSALSWLSLTPQTALSLSLSFSLQHNQWQPGSARPLRQLRASAAKLRAETKPVWPYYTLCSTGVSKRARERARVRRPRREALPAQRATARASGRREGERSASTGWSDSEVIMVG